MEIIEQFQQELDYLNNQKHSSIMISTTAKHALSFRVLPRRSILNTAMSCFMINDAKLLKKALLFFDGLVDYIYIDIEQKQDLNLFEIARSIVKKSNLTTVKPNDNTLESCDMLIRNHLKDDLLNKDIAVVGTGNLASKLATRLTERQANVYIMGRTNEKEKTVTEALNLFLPKHTSEVKPFEEIQSKKKVDIIVSFLSGQMSKEDRLLSLIDEDTFVIDGGINNFSSSFIQRMLSANVKVTRLDTRIALPYQMLLEHDYTQSFFNEVFGHATINDVLVAAGGYIGGEGTVVVDNLKQPNQVIGIADGSGGVKANEQLSEADRNSIRKIEKAISTSS
ncbi:NAD(P)-binding domain-containing protein [Lentibacillus kapialis]|uniref:NAD(P)-binding domain-containing protein n=1 Tax=Lentibacillus kapialis TaxID=340214 RepID=UPI001669FEEF|nr:NAD(P)-binding domain-containing protein [Lentibacillus kapialis]